MAITTYLRVSVPFFKYLYLIVPFLTKAECVYV